MTRLMPAHPDALRALTVRLRDAQTAQERDVLLDKWLDYMTCATEWDAENWGFDPDRWLHAERQQMDERATRAAAREAMQKSADSQQGERE